LAAPLLLRIAEDVVVAVEGRCLREVFGFPLAIAAIAYDATATAGATFLST